MFAAEELRAQPNNHCVPVLDEFCDEEDASTTYIVMPFLRHVFNPEPWSVYDGVDIIQQLLEVRNVYSRRAQSQF